MAEKREFEAGPWRVTVTRSHILKSSCEKQRSEGCTESADMCSVCRFSHELLLPSLPEMVFPENRLQVEHGESGCGLEFSALEALRLVQVSGDPLKVAAAEEWGRTRAAGLQEVKEIVKPFDWTFTTKYCGSLTASRQRTFQVEETEERIDYDRLKQQERIYFYDEVILYEDELADNGTAVLTAKIRVMASGFFILLRFFLRVDGVLVRLNDTRIYHQAGSSYLLREYSSKEAKIPELRAPTGMLTDPNKLGQILPTTELIVHKLVIPEQRTDS